VFCLVGGLIVQLVAWQAKGGGASGRGSAGGIVVVCELANQVARGG
jgi:hypothetical protein